MVVVRKVFAAVVATAALVLALGVVAVLITPIH
jgi:hypothetical protein